MFLVGLILTTLFGCGPAFLEDEEQVDRYLSRGDYETACKGLLNPREELQAYTAEKLGKYPEQPAAGTCLCEAVYDLEAGTWNAPVAKALAGSGFDQVVGCLEPALTDARVTDTEAVVQAVAAIGGTKAFEALAGLAKQAPDPAVKAAAVHGLRGSADHVDLLVEIGKTAPSADLRTAALAALDGSGEKAARDLLLDRLKADEDAAVRAAAAAALSSEASQSTIREALCRAMEDDDPGVRKTALTAFKGTKSERAASCLVAMLERGDDDGSVRVALLEALQASPAKRAGDALCDQIGPWLRKYVKDQIAMQVEGAWIIDAQNERDWERSYECVRKALSQSGYSCYARNHLGGWMNDLGGSASRPLCPGMVQQ